VQSHRAELRAVLSEHLVKHDLMEEVRPRCLVCCLLSAVCCLLSAVCCLLSAVCCLLSAVCCLLSAVASALIAMPAVSLRCCAAASALTEPRVAQWGGASKKEREANATWQWIHAFELAAASNTQLFEEVQAHRLQAESAKEAAVLCRACTKDPCECAQNRFEAAEPK